MYETLGGKAWRNGMVAGVNAALEQGHIGLVPHDNQWIDDDNYPKNKIFAFDVNGIAAVVSLRRCTWSLDKDELSVHVALWATDHPLKIHPVRRRPVRRATRLF
jgi:hypothetical protein